MCGLGPPGHVRPADDRRLVLVRGHGTRRRAGALRGATDRTAGDRHALRPSPTAAAGLACRAGTARRWTTMPCWRERSPRARVPGW
jgi:hypothetical protein